MTATLIDSKGNAMALDAKAYDAVQTVLQALGLAPEPKVPSDVRLTTGQAAKIVGTSSKTIARLIDAGRLPGARMGKGHRSVMLSDLMEFDRLSKANAKANLQEMRDIAEEDGWYDHDQAVSAYLDSLS
ncbi:excisionase family DNA-binding protein [Rubneribacter sp.]|nr:excisionase family DNA-binding protein [Candidatus Rubneribacter avistercoris]